MKSLNTLACSAAILAFTLGFAQAQDGEAPFELPEQCASGMQGGAHAHMGGSSDDGGAMGMGMEGMDMEAMTDAQRANMEAMMATMPAMHEGLMHDDPDIAFACGMIAHHQGAIEMAKVQLEYGEDEAMRELAQTIIDAQKREIEEMTQWLAEHAN